MLSYEQHHNLKQKKVIQKTVHLMITLNWGQVTFIQQQLYKQTILLHDMQISHSCKHQDPYVKEELMSIMMCMCLHNFNTVMLGYA